MVAAADGEIVAGHTRHRAARKLGMASIPTVDPGDLIAADIRAFRIADNKVSELTHWDDRVLALEMSDLCMPDMPPLPGFDDDEIAFFRGLATATEQATDRLPLSDMISVTVTVPRARAAEFRPLLQEFADRMAAEAAA